MTDEAAVGSKVTMREVAQRAGVGLGSVSRVLSGHPAVSEDLRHRVLVAVSELDYEPDFTAMSLRRGSTMTVAFLVRDIASPLFADLVKAAEGELRKDGYSVLLMDSDGDPARDAAHLRLFTRRRVDGLIASLVSENHQDCLNALKAFKAPVVLIDRRVPEIEAGAVNSDHYGGIRAAVLHLTGRGHRRIALVTGSREVFASRERVRGYRSGLRSASVAFDPVLLRAGGYAADHGSRETEALLTLADPPTAIVTGGAMLGYGALRALRDRGRRVPEDVELVPCDPWPYAELFAPRLTSVRRDTALMGRTAARLLLDQLRGATPREVTLETRLDPVDPER